MKMEENKRTGASPAGPRTKPVSLSGRLRVISALAGTGRVVCDVGCDHAHIPIRLLQEKRFQRAIGMDVIEGPLGKAAGNLRLYGMEERVELRLSDGLDAFRPGEADALIVAGMGGSMIREILLREPEKTASFEALVLGPQSDPDKVRSCLRTLGFTIGQERLFYEDGKYYPILRAVRDGARDGEASTAEKTTENRDFQAKDGTAFVRPGQKLWEEELWEEEIPAEVCQAAEDLFGPVLLRERDPVLLEYLVRQTRVLEKILESVRRAVLLSAPQGSPAGSKEGLHRMHLHRTHLERQAQIEKSLEIFRAALRVYETTPAGKKD